jgi:hypothetical protein
MPQAGIAVAFATGSRAMAACGPLGAVLPFPAEETMSRFPNPLSACATLALVTAIAFATPVRAEDIRLVSGDVFTSGDLGGLAIGLVDCDGSLDGTAIDGLDQPGEWIKWHLTLAEPFCFVDSLRSSGTLGVIREFVTEYTPDPPAEGASQDTVFTVPGSGVG